MLVEIESVTGRFNDGEATLLRLISDNGLQLRIQRLVDYLDDLINLIKEHGVRIRLF